ncbi:MAG: hypothetical protein KFW07_01740 [Mycoplasmataceae bacterium]|nr:hypothetical protein [Mycoplasmataceae bacterium]
MENVENQQQVIAYSKWNKLVVASAEYKSKKWFNILKYSTALLITVFGLMSLWFSALWQTSNVLGNLGIDVTKWSNYLSTDASGVANAGLIKIVSEYNLWDLKNASLTEPLLQFLSVVSILGMFSILPLIIFRNGTSWSIGSLVLSWVLLILIVTLFSIGLSSQSYAIEVGNSLVFANAGQVDNINQAIASQQALLALDPTTGEPLVNPSNAAINEIIERLIGEKNILVKDFMAELSKYLNLF